MNTASSQAPFGRWPIGGAITSDAGRCATPSGTQFARFSVGVVGGERPLGQGGGALVGDRDRPPAAEGRAPTVVAALDS
ncbi:hypothetical protein [Mycobacterium sp.]|jgi:hypothetical protein|uniref:hypothetical protein n=1 Tax=Mycobacterium sp. TaxID=1785 RepID=UPI003BB1D285